ncbi:MAG: hypothetical protein L0211_07250 [Planctomycetaceae bacterium]|nr:hypothetical protein [Planctomycetaceae bacterium]
MLSLSPTAGELLPATDWLHPIETDDVAMDVSGSLGFHIPEIDLGDFPLAPVPLPGIWPPGSPPQEPSWTPPGPPSGDLPNPSDPGGMIDIGDLENTGPDTFGDPASKREMLAVARLLASLNYRPGTESPEFSLPAAESPADAEYDPLPESSAPSGQQIHETRGEGGMMAIAADAMASQFVDEAISSIGHVEPLPVIPVRMDNAHGKFQVFEVSTTEETPAPKIPPDPISDMTGRPLGNHVLSIGIAAPEPAASENSPEGCPPSAVDEPTAEDIPALEVLVAPPAAGSPVVDEKDNSWTASVALLAAVAGITALGAQLTKRESSPALPTVPST